jgi:phage/plasmid-associated DNA primase
MAAEDRADFVLEVRAGILRVLLKQTVDLLLEGDISKKIVNNLRERYSCVKVVSQ